MTEPTHVYIVTTGDYERYEIVFCTLDKQLADGMAAQQNGHNWPDDIPGSDISVRVEEWELTSSLAPPVTLHHRYYDSSDPEPRRFAILTWQGLSLPYHNELPDPDPFSRVFGPYGGHYSIEVLGTDPSEVEERFAELLREHSPTNRSHK